MENSKDIKIERQFNKDGRKFGVQCTWLDY